jgi:hypothetical protein
MTVEIATQNTASSVSAMPIDLGAGVWSHVPRVVSRGVPVAVSRGQAYYWSHTWQEAERESLEALVKGDAERFENPADAIRWLLGPDPE